MKTIESEAKRLMAREYEKYIVLCLTRSETAMPPEQGWFEHYSELRKKYGIKLKDGTKKIAKTQRNKGD